MFTDNLKILNDNGYTLVRNIDSSITMSDDSIRKYKSSYIVEGHGERIDLFFDKPTTEQEAANYFVRNEMW